MTMDTKAQDAPNRTLRRASFLPDLPATASGRFICLPSSDPRRSQLPTKVVHFCMWRAMQRCEGSDNRERSGVLSHKSNRVVPLYYSTAFCIMYSNVQLYTLKNTCAGTLRNARPSDILLVRRLLLPLCDRPLRPARQRRRTGQTHDEHPDRGRDGRLVFRRHHGAGAGNKRRQQRGGNTFAIWRSYCEQWWRR